MSIAETTELADVLRRVTTWPTTLRITLARKILESVDEREVPTDSFPKTRGFSTDDVQNLLKMDRRADDAETGELLGTIDTHEAGPPPRTGSLRGLLGILKTDAPTSNDEECRAILEEELIKKHLK